MRLIYGNRGKQPPESLQTDYYVEHRHKFRAYFQPNKFISKDQVTGTTDGKPFGNAFNDPEKDGFNKIRKKHLFSPFLYGEIHYIVYLF